MTSNRGKVRNGQRQDIDYGPDLRLTEIDTSIAHPARVYDYLFGGPVNFTVDREAADRGVAALPGGMKAARAMVRSQRAFLAAAVRYLAGDARVRQFLDIGTGIPNSDNVHGVAQLIAPECRIVYVDRDPVVLAHAHQLLRTTPEGDTAYLDADLRHPELIVEAAAEMLDFAEPVGLVLVGILHLIATADDPWGIVARLLDAVAPGSYLVVSHLASDVQPELAVVMSRVNKTMTDPFVLRTRGEVARFVDGLELVEPGLVTLDQWPTVKDAARSRVLTVPAYCAIGCKP